MLYSTCIYSANYEFEEKVQTMTQNDKKIVIAKNLTVAVLSCTAYYGTTGFFAVIESVPIFGSGFAQVLAEVVEKEIYKRSLIVAETERAVMLGGLANGIAELSMQLFSDIESNDPIDIEKIKNAVKDGYSATRKTLNWYKSCDQSKERLSILFYNLNI